MKIRIIRRFLLTIQIFLEPVQKFENRFRLLSKTPNKTISIKISEIFKKYQNRVILRDVNFCTFYRGHLGVFFSCLVKFFTKSQFFDFYGSLNFSSA